MHSNDDSYDSYDDCNVYRRLHTNSNSSNDSYDDYKVFHGLNEPNATRAKQKPKPYKVAGISYEKFNIKTGFNSAFDRVSGKGFRKASIKLTEKNIVPMPTADVNALNGLIDAKVKATSLWIIEAGLYIHFSLYKLLASNDTRAINAEFNKSLPPSRYYFKPYFMQLIGDATIG